MIVSGRDIELVDSYGSVKNIENINKGSYIMTTNGEKEVTTVEKKVGMLFDVSICNTKFLVPEEQLLTLSCMKDCEFGKKGEFIKICPKDIPYINPNVVATTRIPLFIPHTNDITNLNLSCFGKWLVTSEDSLPKLLKSFSKKTRNCFLNVFEVHRMNMFRKEFPSLLHRTTITSRMSIIRGILKVLKPKILKCAVNSSTLRKFYMVIYLPNADIQSNIKRVLYSLGYDVEDYTSNCLQIFSEDKDNLKRLWKKGMSCKKSFYNIRIGRGSMGDYTMLDVDCDPFTLVYVNNYYTI